MTRKLYPSDEIKLLVYLPMDLHARLKDMSRSTTLPMKQLAVESILRSVEQWEQWGEFKLKNREALNNAN